MPKANELEIAQAFSRFGQVALWLAESWQVPAELDEILAIAAKDWAGVWSDSRDPTLADRMEQLWHDEGRSRKIVQVPDTLEESLGSDFRFVDFAPYMFLRGRGDHKDSLDEITREDSRVDKVRELGRLDSCLLLIAGASTATQALHVAAQAGRRADHLRRIVILGLELGEHEQEFRDFAQEYPALAPKVATYPDRLVALIRQIQTLTILREDRVVRVGSRDVLLTPLLQQEPPITQDYAVLTTNDIAAAPQEGEDESLLLADLLAGKMCPWRSIARGMAWDGRPELTSWRTELSNAIVRIRKNEKKIVVVDIDVEPGSGATVLLSQLAVLAATQNCPTLFHLAGDATRSYPGLRTFLTDLYRDIGGADALVPAVIFFDVDSLWNDVYGYLDLLPSRLNRDGRRAVIVRARQVGGPWAPSEHKVRQSADIGIVRIEKPLREQFTEREALHLASWLEEQYRRLNNDALPTGWYQRFRSLSNASECPFLITVSLLLVERYRDVARLGERLLSRLQRVISAVEAERHPPRLPVDETLDDGVARGLKKGLQFGAPATVDAEQFCSVAVVLAAMGCLRVSVPRPVLAHLAGVDPAEIFTTSFLLERTGLILTREAVPSGSPTTMLGAAYRTKPASVQLVHHEYGRLLLECLIDRCTDTAPRLPAGIASELVSIAASAMQGDNELGPGCIGLLRPVLKSLRPGEPGDREFAEQLAQRFLRVQREKGLTTEVGAPPSEEHTFRRWQWVHRLDVLSGFEWLPEKTIRTSASLLHSRAITRAKCTLNENPSQARPLYVGAEDDLIAALELDEANRSDKPAHMLSTLGMVYVHWAHMEREHGDPEERVQELDELADRALREARSLQLDSAYPAYHLATHKVDMAEYLLGTDSASARERAAVNIAEALELLSGEPEPNFRVEWDELLRRAVDLLGDEGQAVIRQLKNEGKILGWALEALRELNGEFPRQRDVEIKEEWLARAWAILEEGFANAKVPPTPIAQLLRYAVFSFREEREKSPAYDRRLELLRPLVNARYFEDEPLWQFDYGMLCYQNGDHEEGAKTFRELRRGQRFFYIPNERAAVLTESPTSLQPREFTLQVQSIDTRTGHGWARIARPEPFPDPVPFAVRAFTSRGITMSVRATRSCHITIRPAGPFAEPIIKR